MYCLGVQQFGRLPAHGPPAPQRRPLRVRPDLGSVTLGFRVAKTLNHQLAHSVPSDYSRVPPPRRAIFFSRAIWRPYSTIGTAGVPPTRTPAGTSWVTCDQPAICTPVPILR
jgi:hypothetical protein